MLCKHFTCYFKAKPAEKIVICVITLVLMEKCLKKIAVPTFLFRNANIYCINWKNA